MRSCTTAVLILLAAGCASPPPSERWTRAREPLDVETADPIRLARERAPIARECFLRSRAVLEGWWECRDPVTGLLPRRTDQQLWAPADNAADLFPFLVLSAHYTLPELAEEVRALQRREVELTTRLGWLPDWYSIRERRFRDAEPEIARIVFGATEYAKDGLNPLIELLGPDPWQHRMRQLLEGVFEHAQVRSDFGLLPSGDAEVNGELLQTLTRFHFLTDEDRFLEWAERIADAYCLEVLPRGGWLPAHRWDFSAHRAIEDRLSLNDHGNEIVGGLAEVFAAAHFRGRPSARRWEKPLRRMFDTLLDRARNDDGLWYTALEPSSGKVLSEKVPDTWGYALAGTVAFGLTVGEERYLEAARRALRNIDQDRYLEWGGADSFADSIEGGLLLLNRFPEPAGFAWLERVLPGFFAHQKLPAEGGTGIVEGWYGDGNYARTALMVAFWCTRGASLHPWSEDLSIGGASVGGRLVLVLSSSQPWSGRLRFDRPRHREHFRLPHDLPRLNQFPEWHPLEPGELYEVRVETASEGGATRLEPFRRLGSELIAGLELELDPDVEVRIEVEPAGPPPYGSEEGGLDPLALLEDEGGDAALLASLDLEGHGRHAGETYRWVARGPIEWRPKSEVGPIDATLWLRWGSRDDRRRARVSIGPRELDLERGGWDGFDWVAIDVPAAWWSGDELDVRIEKPSGPESPAFLSSLRLRRLAPRPAPGCFELRLEAEELEGDWREQTNVPGFTGAGFRVSNARGIAPDPLRRRISLPGGRVNFWARGFEGHGEDRRFALSLGGRMLPPTHRGRWTGRFSWVLAGTLDAPEGPCELELMDAGPGYEVADAVWISSDLAFDPGVAERVEHALLATAGEPDLVERIIEECGWSAIRSHGHVALAQLSPEEWLWERLRLRARLGEALGLEPPPPRTPLRARVLGALEREGYRVERVVFESRPGFPVTANVYVPDRAEGERRPAVLCPTGHWGLAKTEPVVQARCIGLAKQGYVVLTYDPFGQGERAVEGNDHHEYFRSILVGRNNLSFMVWDTIRALDYLLERPDVDPRRIACTGASGGGLNTLYAAAVDERIGVAVPVVYVTRLWEFLETRITHCPCSHVNGLASFMDMGDVAGLIAPRPLLLITAGRDPSFTPGGAREAADQAFGAYRAFGAEDRRAVREFDAEHDYDRPMREALYGWLALHILGEGDGSPRPEPELSPEPDPAVLHCFPEGRVPAEAETVHSLSRARAAELASRTIEPKLVRDGLRALLGGSSGGRAEPLAVDEGLLTLHREARPGERRRPVLYDTPEGLAIAGWRIPGRAGEGPLVVVLGEDGGEMVSDLVEGALPRAREVIAFDPRGAAGGRDVHLLATDSHLLGDPLLFRRARALVAVLRELEETERPLVCIADGLRPALILLVAQAAHPTVDAISVRGLPESLLELFDGDPPAPDLAAWRLLELGDLPALVEAAGVPVVRLGEEGGSSGRSALRSAPRAPGRASASGAVR